MRDSVLLSRKLDNRELLSCCFPLTNSYLTNCTIANRSLANCTIGSSYLAKCTIGNCYKVNCTIVYCYHGNCMMQNSCVWVSVDTFTWQIFFIFSKIKLIMWKRTWNNSSKCSKNLCHIGATVIYSCHPSENFSNSKPLLKHECTIWETMQLARETVVHLVDLTYRTVNIVTALIFLLRNVWKRNGIIKQGHSLAL